MTAAEVNPDRILRELAGLWESLGKKPNPDGTTATLRACAMTLIVAPVEDSEAGAVSESLAELMRVFPSRAIVVRLDPASAVLEARVFAQCWLPFGQRQQLCCEQIEVTASTDRLGDLHTLLLPLIAPDLPVVLWCRGNGLLNRPEAEPLLTFPGTLLIDSSNFPEPRPALNALVRLSLGVRRVGDLSWTRITPWRQAIAQVFECESNRKLIPAVELIRVRGGEAQRSTAAWYLAGWLSARLPQARLDVAASGKPGPLDSVSLEAPGWTSTLGLSPCGLALKLNSTVSHIVLPDSGDAALLAGELSILGNDPEFERALQHAVRLAAEAG